MSKIDERTIGRIMSAVNIVDVIRDFEPNLRKSGTGYSCLCPFHDDRHVGSFSVSPSKNMCYCFSCEKGGDAVYYLMEAQGMSYPDAIRWLGRKYGIEVEGSEKFANVRPGKPREYQLPADLPTFTLPMSMYERSTKGLDGDVLVRWLRSHLWDASQRSRIDDVLKAYHLGTATTKKNEQFTIFWYLNELGELCTGKMIRYKYNGKRMKKEDGVQNATDWVHAWLYRSPVSTAYDREKVDWKRTYFGMHLVPMYPMATVNIVESEKTAVIMAIAYGNRPDSIWVACGSKTNITHRRLAPLIRAGRNIVLYPDRDAVDEWKAAADAIGYRHLSVNDEPVTKWWRPEDGEKADIADIVLRMTDKGNPYMTVGDSPALQKMKERLDLEVVEYGRTATATP